MSGVWEHIGDGPDLQNHYKETRPWETRAASLGWKCQPDGTYLNQWGHRAVAREDGKPGDIGYGLPLDLIREGGA